MGQRQGGEWEKEDRCLPPPEGEAQLGRDVLPVHPSCSPIWADAGVGAFIIREDMVLHGPLLPLAWHSHSPLLHPSGACRPKPVPRAYLGFEGNELQNHLHSEEASEEHVEDVHGDFEQAALPVVLRAGGTVRRRQGPALLTTLISMDIFPEPLWAVQRPQEN